MEPITGIRKRLGVVLVTHDVERLLGLREARRVGVVRLRAQAQHEERLPGPEEHLAHPALEAHR